MTEAERIQRVVHAFTHLRPSEREQKLIQVVLDNPGLPTSSLSEKMGWKKGGAWHREFGKLCKKRESLLWPGVPDDRPEPYYGGILVAYNKITHGVTLRPEVVEGFARLGMTPSR